MYFFSFPQNSRKFTSTRDKIRVNPWGIRAWLSPVSHLALSWNPARFREQVRMQGDFWYCSLCALLLLCLGVTACLAKRLVFAVDVGAILALNTRT